MSTRFFTVAFAIGLVCLAWVGLGFAGSSWLALAITAVISGVYLLGAFELKQFRAATGALGAALQDLSQPPSTLAEWLAAVPPSLRHAVRLRIDGERGGLPGPALTPYLVGLLVMLGMLGTFLGMIVTFKGAMFALEGSTDLQAIRSALAAPLQGLGMSFGTSVAGVAASAMLGLMSAISRRERLEVGRQLDHCTATVLLPFSLAHQRHEAFRALQLQAHALPEVAGKLEALMERIERRSAQLDQQLLERQAQFQREVTLAYTELAGNVGASLKDSLAAGARASGETMQQALGSFAQTFEQRSAALVATVGESVARTQSDQAVAEQQRLQAWAALRHEEGQRGEAAIQQLHELQAAVAQHLATLGTALETPITRLLQTVAEVPQAAAGVIGQLREEMGRIAERDNLALQERAVLLERLDALLQAVHRTTGEQRAGIEGMVDSASTVLQRAGEKFAQALEQQASQTADVAAHVSGSALELSSLAEAFDHGVQRFQASNDKLVDGLQRVESALNRSTARSDEQLAYYVAQAREVIDLSIASQQGLVENLRQLQGRQGKSLALVEGGRG